MKKELIEKVEKWFNSLTKDDFYPVTGQLITGYNTPENREKVIEVEKRTGLRIASDSELEIGDYYIVDSIYTPEYLSIVKKIKGKKGHKVVEKLALKSKFELFAWGYFAIPYFN